MDKKIDFFHRPAQVVFKVKNGNVITTSAGIAYKDEVICACCGGVYRLSEIEKLRILTWIDISEEIAPDEFFDLGDEEIDEIPAPEKRTYYWETPNGIKEVEVPLKEISLENEKIVAADGGNW